LEHSCVPLLAGRLCRGVSNIDVGSDTNDAGDALHDGRNTG